MGAEGGRQAPPVAEEIRARAARFDFFQAVRVLERIARCRGWTAGGDSPPVGGDDAPESEVVRFRAVTGLSFPEAAVLSVRDPDPDPEGRPVPPEMTVGVGGLTGPLGVLPDHYTVLLMRAARLKDTALRDFLDLLDHRVLSLFYRTWEKYRPAPAHERALLARRRPGEDGKRDPDLFTLALLSLVGLGTGGLRGRREVPDDAYVFYSGAFSRGVRDPASLEALLSEYFDLPVSVEPFQGRWLLIDPRDRSLLPDETRPRGRFNRLGEDMVLGDRSFDVEGKFRVRVGPVPFATFRRLLPRPHGGRASAGDMLGPLCEITRSYAGVTLDFDVQVVLAEGEAPRALLGVEHPEAAVLGWCAWLHADPVATEAGDAVFDAPSIAATGMKGSG